MKFRRFGFVMIGAVSVMSVSVYAGPKVSVTIDVPPDTDVTILTVDEPAIQIALLLDTSNSMDGLINQAKSQLWSIVNEFAKTKHDGQSPPVQVAMFEYGNNNLPSQEGYIRQVLGLTRDLDSISEALFALSTNGGDEYCGQTISESLKRLAWSSSNQHYKAIFIAGNEPFTQGPVHYEYACRLAQEKGIVVNTIHCGAYDTGVQGMWQQGARLGGGTYMNIDQDQSPVHIDAPQDDEIMRLNIELNATYIPYGPKGESFKHRQEEQDRNAASISAPTLAERVQTKNSGLYTNSDWDLVDAAKDESFAISKVEKEHLPETMQKMTEEEQVAYINQQTSKRQAIQNRIAQLTQEREAYVEAEKKKLADQGGESTLGDVMVESVRKQLKDAGYEVAE